MFGEPEVFDDDPVTATVAVPGGTWRLAASPAGGWSASMPGTGLLAGYAGASWLALTLALWVFLSWPVRLAKAVDEATVALARARDNLEREVEARTRDLRQANAALSLGEGELRALRDHAPVGIFSSTPDGRYLAVNAFLARMYGYATPRDMLAGVVNIQDQHYFDPDERDAMLARIDAEGVINNYETRRLTRQGEVIWVSLSMRALRDASGAVRRYEGFCIEISQRKQAEAVLARQERELRVVFENSPLGLVSIDAAGTLVKCNQRFLDQMGTAAERVIGRSLPPDMPEFIRTALLRALGGEPSMAEGFYVSITGTGRLHVRVFFNPVEPGHAPSAVIATVEDTSADHAKEAALRLLWAAVEASPASIVITDVKGIIEYVNPHFAALTGYTPDEARGQNPSVLKSGVHDEAFYREMWETIVAGRVWRGQFCNRKKNGELYWEDSSISPIRDETGAITHFVAVKEDITERRRLEQIREDVERIMRHDLKVPLNAVINLPRIVADLGPLGEDQRELLEEIERVGTIMLDQINLSLDLYKMETGTYTPRKDRIDCRLLTRGVVDMLAGLARQRQVTLTFDARDDQTFARGDVVLCRSIFGNLVKNAIEASSAGETVTVRLDGNGRVAWSVHNPGLVPEAVRPVFFEKYVTSGKAGGNGLGTYSARLMTECQGGSIALETAIATGTTVTVTLPGAGDLSPEA